jgi:glycosyltransferase involved in cell wall biosynthesis
LNANAGRAPLDVGVFGARGIPSTYSGYETFLTVLLPELARRGHRVTMYCRAEVGSSGEDFRGVRRRTLPSVKTKQLDTLSHGLVASGVAAFAHHDVALVVNIANVPFVAALRWSGVPVVLNTDGQEWLRGKWGNAARAYFHGSARWAGRAATALVSDCNAMRELYFDDFGADSTVIPYCWNGVLADESDGAGAGPEFPAGSYFVTGGRLVPENTIDLIAEAYVETAHPEPLMVAGEANYASPVVRRLQELRARDPRIRMIGHVSSRPGFRALLGNARAYLHGHSVGGMNPSLVEAMASGAAVVALDTTFNREVLGPEGLFFSRNHDSVRKVLGEVADATPDELARYREQLRTRAHERFDLVPIADAYEELLLSASRSGRQTGVRVATQWEDETRATPRDSAPPTR